MEPWHWHPIFVHFTVALLSTGSILFIIAWLWRTKLWAQNCLTAAKWTFWSGILAALFTSATGLLAYFTVPHIDAALRDLINDHAAAAIVTALFYLILAFFLWRRQMKSLPPGGGWTSLLVIGIALLLYTGYLGGSLVFMYGVGVDAVTTPTAGAPSAK